MSRGGFRDAAAAALHAGDEPGILRPMPVVLPFRAVRPTGRDPLADRLSPPYDVISAAERARLAVAAHNPVHLILPADDPALGEGSRYAVAARALAAWRAEGVLARDVAPAF
ncbi:MAG: DUF1015 family protein, partial [Candidatus Eisenbacteria bacterium]